MAQTFYVDGRHLNREEMAEYVAKRDGKYVEPVVPETPKIEKKGLEELSGEDLGTAGEDLGTAGEDLGTAGEDLRPDINEPHEDPELSEEEKEVAKAIEKEEKKKNKSK